MRSQPQINKFSILAIVVMLLCLNSRVRHIDSFHFNAQLLTSFCNKVGKLIDRKLLGELIEDSELPRLRRVCNGKLNTLNCISYVKETPSLKYLHYKIKTEDYCPRDTNQIDLNNLGRERKKIKNTAMKESNHVVRISIAQGLQGSEIKYEEW